MKTSLKMVSPECVNGNPVGCIEVGPVPNPSIPGESFLDTPMNKQYYKGVRVRLCVKLSRRCRPVASFPCGGYTKREL